MNKKNPLHMIKQIITRVINTDSYVPYIIPYIKIHDLVSVIHVTPILKNNIHHCLCLD